MLLRSSPCACFYSFRRDSMLDCNCDHFRQSCDCVRVPVRPFMLACQFEKANGLFGVGNRCQQFELTTRCQADQASIPNAVLDNWVAKIGTISCEGNFAANCGAVTEGTIPQIVQSQHRLRLSEMMYVPLTIAETLEIPYAPTRTTTGMRNPLALVTDRREAAWMRVGNPFHIKRPPQRSRVSMINGTAQNRKSPCHGLGKHPQPRPSV